MKTKTTISISQARKNIFSIAEEVQVSEVYYTLTERGRPKAVVLSAEGFEKLTERKEKGLMLSDNSCGGYFHQNSHTFPKILIIRDESKVIYLSDDDHDLKYREEALIKSQLYIDLIEKYKYPLRLVELGRYVKVGGKDSKRYIEADIIINDKKGNVQVIFEVAPFCDFDEKKDKIVADLFELAYASTWVKKPECLVYFSRTQHNGKTQEKIAVIDYTKFNTFISWKKAGRPCAKEIPSFFVG